MREVLKYIGNLHFTIKAQNKGIRRLVRKNKRLKAENAELTELLNLIEENHGPALVETVA